MSTEEKDIFIKTIILDFLKKEENVFNFLTSLFIIKYDKKTL